ncbi:hypothetical protein BH11PSE4_BH11PSE4_24840 [soil metagenome]
MMDVPEFEDLLGRLGDDLTRWPASQQRDAADLLRISEPARTALAEAKLLRLALRAEPTPAPAGLVDRIMQAARQSVATPGKQADAAPTQDLSRRPREDEEP